MTRPAGGAGGPRLGRRDVLAAAGLGALVIGVRVVPAAPALAAPLLAASGALALGWRRPRRAALALGVGLLACALDVGLLGVPGARELDRARSFFGVHRVTSVTAGSRAYHLLAHGTTLHGAQLADPVTDRPAAPGEPLTYFARGGPVGWAWPALAARAQGAPRRIAIVGLGVGALAAWLEPGDAVTWLEIDPVVVRVAEDERLFSYLADARRRGARVDVVLGDARLTAARIAPGTLDLLVLDAFTSDAVPAHLLTREAFAGWRRVLAPGGAILCNVTNRALNVRRVVGHVAAGAGLVARLGEDLDAPPPGSNTEARLLRSRAAWVAAARAEADLGALARDPRWAPLAGDPARAWTDDHSSLLDLLR